MRRTISERGETALHGVAWFRNTEVVKLLLDAKADINAQDNFGERRDGAAWSGLVPEHGSRDLHALVHREERRLLRVHQDRDDDAIEEPGTTCDDVDVPVGERVERARVNSESGHLQL